jgi:hypothetical protein
VKNQVAAVFLESCEAVMKVLGELSCLPGEGDGLRGMHSRMILSDLPPAHDVYPEGILQEGNWMETEDHINPDTVTEADLEEAERQGKMVPPTKDANVVHWFAAKLTECKVSRVCVDSLAGTENYIKMNPFVHCTRYCSI